MKNKTWYLWGICIAMYILNIVLIAITGADLVNNIVAWSMCIMLAITIIGIDKTNKLDEEMYISLAKVNTLLRLHLIKDKVKGNSAEAVKIIDAEIERLEKEL